MMNVKKMTTMALLTAAALVISLIESQIPPLVPIAGVKLGLANTVTLFALFVLSRRETLCILVMRILLGSVFSGRVSGFIYSFSGGMLCFAVTALLKRFFDKKTVWFLGVVGAVFHNVGQLAAAVLVTGTKEIMIYFPVLLASAVITGTFTGACAQILLDRYFKMRNG